jgi:MIP family channel proteins
MIAEAIGTFLLVFIGTGAIMASGSYVLAFGFGLIAIVYAIGTASGAHVNPAVTFGLAAVGRFPMIQVPYYWLSQVAGALVASLLLRLIHGNVFNLGATSVAESYSLLDGFLMELIATAIFLFVITAVATDKDVHPAVPGLAIGAALLGVQLFAGNVTGGSVNPARSLAPALVSGSFDDLWVYLTAPFIGAVIGVVGYELIRGHEEGTSTSMATNLGRVFGGAASSVRAPQQRRSQPRPEAYAPEDYDVEAPPPPRRQQQRPPQQRQQRPPAAAPYESEPPPPRPPQSQSRQQRPPAVPYEEDVPPQQSTGGYETEPPPQRPPQRRRPPQPPQQ